MSITQDLGVATAYGYAVSKGYTGTEEEFATLMASYATTALKAEGFAVGQQNGVDVDSGSPYYHNNAKYYAVNALAITDTASGAIASFPDGADNMPLKSLVVDISPVQAGSGDPSPDNVRPISGHTGANVRAAGKNLLPLTVYVGVAYNPTVGATFSTTQHGTQWTDNHDGTFTINTSATWQNYGIFMPVRNGHSYFRQFTFTSSGQGGFTEGYLDGDFKVLSKTNATTMPTTKSAGLNWSTYPTAKYYYVVFTNRETASATLTLTNPIVSSGTSAVTYEPYNATTKAVTWQSEAGTVYGGTVDVTGGVLRITKKKHTVSSTDVTGLFQAGTNANRIGIFLGDAIAGTDTATRLSPICNIAAASSTIPFSVGTQALGYCALYNKYLLICVPTSCADGATALSWLVDNGCEFVYELATPIEYTLTPEQVSTLLGQNNIWADTGDVEVEYYADTKLYINKIVAALA